MSKTRNSTRTSRCKLNVILDIDETFLCFVGKEKLEDLRWSYSTNKENERTGYEMKVGKHGAFVMRPHFRKFFEWLFENCNVALWTWSDIDYANDVADLVTNGNRNKFAFIFADTQAEASSDEHGNSKDLNYVWYQKEKYCFAECNTVLIDDLPGNSVNSSNKHNSITIAPFYPTKKDMHDDKSLLEVLAILKKLSKHVKDCYENEDKRYENILSPKNIASLGLSNHVKDVIRKNNKTVRAVAVGKSDRVIELSNRSNSSSSSK